MAARRMLSRVANYVAAEERLRGLRHEVNTPELGIFTDHPLLEDCRDLVMNRPAEVIKLPFSRLLDLLLFILSRAGSKPRENSRLSIEPDLGGGMTVMWVTPCGVVSDEEET